MEAGSWGAEVVKVTVTMGFGWPVNETAHPLRGGQRTALCMKRFTYW